MNLKKNVSLGTYFNNRTGLLNLGYNFVKHGSDLTVRVLVSMIPVREEMKSARPGDTGVYDPDSKLIFAISETELSAFVVFLKQHLFKSGIEWEYKFPGHFSEDKSKVSNLSVKKNPKYSNTMWMLYSNKKFPEGKTVSCAVSENDMYALYFNLNSLLENLSVIKLLAVNDE